MIFLRQKIFKCDERVFNINKESFRGWAGYKLNTKDN